MKLPPVGEDRWALQPHTYIVVYEPADGRRLLTVYDCGAAQKPPSAQVLGDLTSVQADHDIERTPTGYVVRMREAATLVREGEDRWLVVAKK